MKESGDSRLQRYQRQMLLPHLGEAGQRTLLASKVVIIGCGGLGGTISQILARAGVGELTLCDADTVQLDNLHRQILFDEQDVGKPKAIVAAAKLLQINSQVKLNAMPVRVDAGNIRDLVANADLVVDATDNLESRYVLNTAAAALGRDWIYGGCVGMEGTVMVIRNRSGACLECIFGPFDPAEGRPTAPFPILPTTPVVVGAIQANEAIRYLLEKEANSACGSRVICIDLAQVRVRSNDRIGKVPGCGVCGKGATQGAGESRGVRPGNEHRPD